MKSCRLRQLLNERDFRVRLSAWYALWQMQLHAHPRRLWIDSICINQADNEEKSAQVSLMGTIYASAEYVAACLGSGVIFREVMLAIEKHDGDVALNIEKELSFNRYFDRLWIKQETFWPWSSIFFAAATAWLGIKWCNASSSQSPVARSLERKPRIPQCRHQQQQYFDYMNIACLDSWRHLLPSPLRNLLL